MTKRVYDYIIVGGGSAGCVLANRLSADPSKQVLVLEAGRPDHWWDLFIHMPAALTIPIGNPSYDWMYESEPEPHMHGRRIYHARGKVLGGSSSINGMIFQRGNPEDFEQWGRMPGLERWDYAHCLPYFRRMERCLAAGDDHDNPTRGAKVLPLEGYAPPSPDPRERSVASDERSRPLRGTSGPLVLERGPGVNPLFSAFLEAARQAGHPLTDDVNGYRQEGFGLFDRNVRRGRRLSAARAYYHPVRGRENLALRCRVHVARVLFDEGGRRACGVELFDGRGRSERVYGGEVVLCAGAFNSPQLLQLSGVGDPAHLEGLGIDVVHALPGVGENLMDHLEVYIQHRCKRPVSMNPAMKTIRKPWIGLQWLFRAGPAATNHFEAGGFIRSNPEVSHPNLMFHFLPLAVRYDGSAPAGGHGYQVHVGPMFSDARGTLKIRSKDPREHPALRFNYLSTEQDRREWVEAIERAREILRQPALAPFDGGELSPGPTVKSAEEILSWVGKDAETALHPSGTCRMGTDALAVVDPDTLQVHGTENLRVVDASVMPRITNANIYAPTMMIAERACDLLLGRGHAAPDTAPWHRG